MVQIAVRSWNRIRPVQVSWPTCTYYCWNVMRIWGYFVPVEMYMYMFCMDGQPCQSCNQTPVLQPDSWLHNRAFGWPTLYALQPVTSGYISGQGLGIRAKHTHVYMYVHQTTNLALRTWHCVMMIHFQLPFPLFVLWSSRKQYFQNFPTFLRMAC